MQYWAAVLGGIAASALFWLFDKLFLRLHQSWQMVGMIGFFTVTGAAGYWLTSLASGKAAGSAGTRVASGLRGKNVHVKVDGVTTAGGMTTEILSDVDAKGNLKAEVKNIKSTR